MVRRPPSSFPTTFALAAILVVLAAPLRAQDGIRLVSVPDAVRLPAPAGSNLMLEVAVADGPAEVWLATGLAASDRVPLAAAGGDRFQCNLADPSVPALLPAGRERGELIVFARCAGQLLRSAPIAWSRAIGEPAALRCLIRHRDGTTATADGAREVWLDLGQVSAFEIHGAGERNGAPVARLGELELPLTRRDADLAFVLDDPNELRARTPATNTLELELAHGGASAVFRFRLAPTALALPGGVAALTVRQRQSAPVPGSDGWLTVQIDDITMGQVLLELRTADGAALVSTQSVLEREAIPFACGGSDYVLVVDKLVNLLIGDDHAEFSVRPRAGFVPDRIGQLVRAVAASKDVFVREEQEHTGAVAAQFLLARLGPQQRSIGVDEFIDTIASKSSRTGKPYHVRTAAGPTVTMQDWLRAELQRITAAERVAAPPGASR